MKKKQKTENQAPQKYILRRSLWVLLGRILLLKAVLLICFALGEMFFLTENIPGEVYVEELLFYLFLEVVNIFFLGWAILNWYAEKYIIHNDKITIIRGIFQPQEKIHLFKNVESIRLQRSFLGLMLGYGTLRIDLPILQQRAYMRQVTRPKKYLGLLKAFLEAIKGNQKNSRIVIQG